MNVPSIWFYTKKEISIREESNMRKDDLVDFLERLCVNDDNDESACIIVHDMVSKIIGKILLNEHNILSSNYWKNTKTYLSLADRQNQSEYYKQNNAGEEVLNLVKFDSKRFGSEMEKILCELFSMKPRISSQHDAIYNGKKIEIKSARYWGTNNDCIWQHLEPEYDYDYVMLVLLDFHDIKVWCVKKTLLMTELKEKGIIKKQGKQGYWMKKKEIIPYTTEIRNINELSAFIV